MKIISIIKLLRPWQWYKNLVIGLAIIFSHNLFNFSIYDTVILGFLTLCATSSANYIFNDIKDRKQDRKNPEKKHRPLASKEIPVAVAVLLAILLALIGVGGGYLLSPTLGLINFSIIILTTLYTLKLKEEAYVDILLIATNFVLRAIAGAIIIDVLFSPWLIIGTFFFALFLSTGKRRGEAILLKEGAQKHRKNLITYTGYMTQQLMSISTVLLIISYITYVSATDQIKLLIGLPFLLYAILRYYSLVEEGSKISRHPHLAITDKRLVLSGIIFTIITVLIMTMNFL